jgi:hypothetical protein
MIVRRKPDGRRGRTLLTALLVIALAGIGAVAAVAMTYHHARAPTDASNVTAAVTTTAGGTQVVRRTDRRRGLTFELESSLWYGDSSLFARLAPAAPAATRRLLLTRPLMATCTVPGRAVREFAGRWDPRFARYGTALLVDDTRLVIARAATSCDLRVGRDGKAAGTAVFPERAFSRVRIR